MYVGDGDNDYCPARYLDKEYVVYPRQDYVLHKMICDNLDECKEMIHRFVSYIDRNE